MHGPVQAHALQKRSRAQKRQPQKRGQDAHQRIFTSVFIMKVVINLYFEKNIQMGITNADAHPFCLALVVFILFFIMIIAGQQGLCSIMAKERS